MYALGHQECCGQRWELVRQQGVAGPAPDDVTVEALPARPVPMRLC